MTDLNSLSGTPGPNSPASPPRWPLWLLVVVVLVLCSCLGWLFPSYKKVVHDVETLTQEKSDLQQKLDIASKTKVVSRTYFSTGRIASETTSETDTDTRSESDNSTASGTLVRSHEETTVKRGQVGVGVYWVGDSFIPKEVNADSLILGPLGVQAAVQPSPFVVMAGIRLAL